MGRGIGQDTGDIVIKKRLSKRDPKFQSLVNRLQLQNQDNVASIKNQAETSDPKASNAGTIASRRAEISSFNTVTGELLAPDLGKNIFEIITIPYPHFYTALYEVTFWTQYIQHMNQIIERFMTSYDGQGNQFRIDTEFGYWFVAYVGDDFNSDDNFDDYTEAERLVKHTFTVRVPAYLIASQNPGDGSPFRSYLSAPQVSFQLLEGEVPISLNEGAPVGSGDIDKFALSDVDALDKRGNRVLDERQKTRYVRDIIKDPFTGKDTTRLLRVVSRNQRKGETVISSRTMVELDNLNL